MNSAHSASNRTASSPDMFRDCHAHRNTLRTFRPPNVQPIGWNFANSIATSSSSSSRLFPPRATWIENSAQVSVPVSIESCWDLWEDRKSIPRWMPWIASVIVDSTDPRLSRWTLRTEQFGRSWEFSWLATNLTPIRYQKIHWRSVQGSVQGSIGAAIEVPNRGEIRFFKKSPSSCDIKLTISYEVPTALQPFANAITPIVENILLTDLNRFSSYAQQNGKNLA